MFYELPTEIIKTIYEFDATYKELFNTVLQDLTMVRFSRFNNLIFYIFDPISQSVHMTNSLERPYYICTSYEINFLKYSK